MNLESTPIDSSNENENKKDRLTFHHACAKGNLKVVKVYLAQGGFNMNVGDNEGCTGFHFACYNGELNVVQFLLQQGVDMNVGDNKGCTGFHYACCNGKFDVVQFLVEQEFDMNAGDNEGWTGFHDACRYGKLNVVQFLLQQGVDMNVGDNNGTTGFHLACCNGELNVVQFLLQQGVDMNVGDNRGFHLACHYGNLNVIQFLLQRGFNGINEPAGNSKTGLQMLIQYISRENDLFMPCALLLIEAGAELHENDVFEELMCAIQNRIIEITFIKEKLFEKWTGRIAQAITDFTMEPFTNTSLQNLSQFLD